MQDRNFRNPPIVELVCGIQFDCPKYSFAAASHFYDRVKAEFPNCSENPPLPLVFDKLNVASAPAMPRKLPLVRHFFTNVQDAKVIQLQAGRFLFNWRRIDGPEQSYPKFESVFQEFVANWGLLSEVLAAESAEANPTQLELTYIDNILQSDFDKSQWALPKVFSFFAKNPLSAGIDDVNFSMSAPVADLCGHVHLTARCGIRNLDRQPVLILETTARGNTSKAAPSIDDWFNRAHTEIYGTFMDIVTEDGKRAWGHTV